MKDIDYQRAYYDSRWAMRNYANVYRLQRLIAILEALRIIKLEMPRILELGCGTGWLSSVLSEFGPTTGIELSEEAIKVARVRYPSVEFVAGDIFESGIQKRSYDLVVSQEVIEHVQDQERFLSLAAECLRDSGYMIMTTPNGDNFEHWSQDALYKWGRQPIENWVTINSLRNMLRKEFDIIYIRTIIPHFGEKGIHRLLSSPKVRVILSRFRLDRAIEGIALELGLGLHIVALCRKNLSRKRSMK